MRRNVKSAEVDRVDKALSLVGGNFAAAAKLTDRSYRQLKNFINGSARLRERWGKRKIGRPFGPTLNFYVKPYDDSAERIGLPYARALISILTHKEKTDLHRWLSKLMADAPVQTTVGDARESLSIRHLCPSAQSN